MAKKVEKRWEPKMPEDFVHTFQEALKKNRLTLMQVADKSGTSQSYLSRLLNRERGLPSDEKILDIAKALKISPPETLLVAAGRIPSPKESTDWVDVALVRLEKAAKKSREIKKAAQDDKKTARGLAIIGLILLVILSAIEKGKKEKES